MTYKYLVFAVEGKGQSCHAECKTLEEAEFAAQEVVNNASVDSVAIYQLHKVGRRVASVAWDDAPRATSSLPPPPPKSNGAYSQWTDAENVYLREARSMGMSYKGIAKKLGRTPHAVEVQASRLRCG